MKAKVNGTICAVLAPKTGVSKATGKEWKTQDFVLEDEDGKLICFNVFGAQKIEQYGLVVGKQVSLDLEITCTEWQGKYFPKIQCIECYAKDIVKANPRPQHEPQQVAQDPIYSPKVNDAPVSVQAEDLPF